MNIIGMAAVGAAAIVFGPGFIVQAGIGYIAGTACGAYAGNRMKRLHHEICKRTGNKDSDMDELAKYAQKASQIGGVLCPAIPLISLGVGLYCSNKAKDLEKIPSKDIEQTVPSFNVGEGVGVRL